VTRPSSFVGRWCVRRVLVGNGNTIGTVFNVQWECIYDLPFARPDVARLKRSRDGTELPASIGEALCQFMDDGLKLYGVTHILTYTQMKYDFHC
jgi:hypothetical protein